MAHQCFVCARLEICEQVRLEGAWYLLRPCEGRVFSDSSLSLFQAKALSNNMGKNWEVRR